MLKHYLLIILRNIRTEKKIFAINLFCLTAGLTCALTIYLWVMDEQSFDQFHDKKSSIFLLMENQKQNEEINTTPYTSGLLHDDIKRHFPEVENAVATSPMKNPQKKLIKKEATTIKASGIYASEDFFKLFSFDLKEGDVSKSLSTISSIVITEKLAKRLSETTSNIVGKTIEFEDNNLYQVSAVAKQPPPNSSYQFDYVLPFENLKADQPFYFNWGSYGPNTIIELPKGTDIGNLNSKIKNFMATKGQSEAYRTLFATKFSDYYLYGSYDNVQKTGGRIQYVNLFSLIGVVIILLATINFMNLSTAKASKRLKEIGVKRSVMKR